MQATTKQPARTMRFTSCENGVHLLTLTVGTSATRYYCQRIPSDFGRAVRLDKFATEGGESYAINVGGERGNRSSCECLGFLRHGHCKHLDAVKKLLATNKM